jgi:hypothetical protein
MTAQQAAKEYPNCKSLKKKGNSVTVRTPTGTVVVPKNKEIYHRGSCKFGVYSEALDKKRYHSGTKDKLGKGNRRQTKY